VKTGFRHAFGGYAAISGVHPDLAVYGKAIANGYPMAALGGRKEWMDYFVHADASKRALLAGTYNAHPAPVAAAIATIRKLLDEDGEVYRQTEALGSRMERGLQEAIARKSVKATVVRQGSAFCIYFMDHAPADWHDLAGHHDFAFDEAFRRRLLERGVYFFPLAAKQCSISYAHTAEQIDRTLEAVESCLTS
jgi:glutamate-1-semialdehyde 2,1-aminomutase